MLVTQQVRLAQVPHQDLLNFLLYCDGQLHYCLYSQAAVYTQQKCISALFPIHKGRSLLLTWQTQLLATSNREKVRCREELHYRAEMKQSHADKGVCHK